jgi:hypothetical protein
MENKLKTKFTKKTMRTKGSGDGKTIKVTICDS